MDGPQADGQQLRIVHVLRAPLGGLFRHVLDVAREQIARGHQVGMITDSLTGGDFAKNILAELESELELGLLRLPMRRNPHPSDLYAWFKARQFYKSVRPDVIHGHGSKGGLFARLPSLLLGGTRPIRAYTPHGGSFNYNPGSVLHRIYMQAESFLGTFTNVFLFESAFIRDCYRRFVGEPKAKNHVVLNGISDAEFIPVEPEPEAADFIYIGELRSAKGIDTFIDALAELKRRDGKSYTAVLAGTGPDQQALTEQAALRGIEGQIKFPGAMPARRAFECGHVMIVPSRAESLPYVVLEAAGAQIPMIATNVGGIPEIFGPYADRLIPCDNHWALADAIQAMHSRSPRERADQARELAAFVESTFHTQSMVDSVIAGYRDALAKTPAPVAAAVKQTDKSTAAA